MGRFAEGINNAATASIPRTSAIPGRRALRWWSPDVKAAVKARRKALRAMKRLPADHPDKNKATEKYKKERNECKQIIRDAKTASWQEFIDGVSSSNTSMELWRRVNALSGKRKSQGITLVTPNGNVTDPYTVANTLGEYFHSLSALGGYSVEFARTNSVSANSITSIVIPNVDNNPYLNQPFQLSELTLALAVAKGKSAGHDEIGYPLLKKLTINGKLKLLEIFNRIWNERDFPPEWNHSLVVPIKKSDQNGRAPEHYRPISLTCCTSKIMERMVNRRLTQHLYYNNLLDPRQHAFRPGCGTNTYFGTLSDALDEARKENLHVELAALDIAKAYNRAWMPAVIEQLIRWGITGHMLHFIKGFLSMRSFQVMIGDKKSRSFNEETGVPQGSVLAVTLFLIKMNSVFNNLPRGIRIFVYADDVVLMVVGKTVKALRRKLTQAANYVARWASSVGFQLSASKSEYIHICNLNHRILNTPIKINGVQIPRRTNIKILGVTIDRLLTFDAHYNQIKEDCSSRINLIKALAGRHANTNRVARLNVSNMIINSRLTYGLELTIMSFQKLVEKLGPTYRQAIRITTGLLPSTPRDSVCAESGMLPFRYYVIRAICHRAISFIAKTYGSEMEGFLLTEANRLLKDTTNQELPPVAGIHWCGTRGWNLPNIRTDLAIKNKFKAGSNPDAVRASVLELLHTKYKNYIARYTDGSVARGRVGVGITGTDIALSSRLPDQDSIFTAEAAAIVIALSSPTEKPMIILTDSASVIMALSSETPTHPYIQWIQKFAPPGTVFSWIPGHCGVPGNVEADQLAATGRMMEKWTRQVPAADLKRWTTDIIWNSWSGEWWNTSTTFLRKIKGDTCRWEDPPDHCSQVVISRLRCGHTRVSHNFAGRGDFRSKCETCDTHNSVEHFICNCPRYQEPRNLYGIPTSIRDALGDDPSQVAALIAFLKEARLYHSI